MNSLATARFPVLPLSKEKEATHAAPLNRDTAVSGDEPSDEVLIERIRSDNDEALTVHRKTFIFDPAKGPPRTLIVYLTYQLAYKRRRYLRARHGYYSYHLNESAANSPAVTASFYDESIEAHFGRDGLRKALADLSEPQRETLRLYFFEGYALDEIASKLEQSIGNVRHHYFRGLEKLRKHVPKGPGIR